MSKIVEIGRIVENNAPKIVAREVDESGKYGKPLVSFNVADDSISASYCRIVFNDDNTVRAELVDKAGGLWVNGREYVCKSGLTRNDVLFFGERKIRLELGKFIGVVRGYDIGHLKHVWESYKAEQESLRKKDILMKKLGSLPTYILLAAAAMTGAAGHDLGVWRWVIMIAFLLGMALYEFFKSDTLAAKLDALRDKFADDYVCPSCGNYLGEGKSWNLLSKTDACPHCKARFYIGNE